MLRMTDGPDDRKNNSTDGGVNELTRELRRESGERPPRLLMIAVVALTVMAGLGEWKVLNSALGGLPKIITLGVPGLALLCFLVRADFDRMGRCLACLPVFMLFIVTLLLWTLVVWLLQLTDPSSIARAVSKLVFQTFTILYAVGFVYLCREKAVDCFFCGMVLTNSIIAVLEIPGYGLSESLKSVITCIVTFGDAEGYVRALEIHDVTFLFGQFFVYYAALACGISGEHRRRHWLFAGIAMFFMLLGLKRTAIPAAILWAAYAAFVIRRRHPIRWIMATGIALVALFWGYLYIISTGLFSQIMASLGVDMMGRDYLWKLARPYYTLSPFFTGHGFEAVDAIVGRWYQQGILRQPFAFHNDVLKVYVELGFGGFCLWCGLQYILYPRYWARRHGTKQALVYICLLGYMSVTYMTDNTAFYYWSSIGLRLIPMAYALSQERPQSRGKWRPPEPDDFAREVWLGEMEAGKGS